MTNRTVLTRHRRPLAVVTLVTAFCCGGLGSGKLVAAPTGGSLCEGYNGLPEGFGPGEPGRPNRAGLVNLRGGHFLMGSDQGYAEERVPHEVDVSGFAIDRHEVTNAQFAAFVRATGYVTRAERQPSAQDAAGLPPFMRVPGAVVFVAPSSERNPANAYRWWRFVPGAQWRAPEGPGSTIEGRDNHPVVQIALEDALAYAHWLGRELPTEAQWEYAARGGLDGRTYPWGDEPRPGGRWMVNNWQGPYPIKDFGEDGHAGRAPVGCYPANGFGLNDMVGNVWEWTVDRYRAKHPVNAERDPMVVHVSERDEGLSADTRVIKGGSFLCSADFCLRYRPSARQPQDPLLSTVHLGFRTVLREAEVVAR